MATYVKFLRGTPTAYNNLKVKNQDTLYFVAEKDAATGELYLGEVKISGSISEPGVAAYLNQLNDVDTSGAMQNSLLGFDSNKNKWVPMDISDLISMSIMVGATNIEPGIEGLVPAPKAGEDKYFLQGDGSWAPMPKDEELQNAIDELSQIINGENGLLNQISDLNTSKANKEAVYTKEETDSAIELAVSNISQLTRKIVDKYEDIQDYVNNHDDAEKYIFMIPSDNYQEPKENRYDEYIVLKDENGHYFIEQIGSWSTNLEDYVLKSELINSYYDKSSVDTLLDNKINVEELNEWVTDNRDNVLGLYPTLTEQKIEKALADLDTLTTKTNANSESLITTNVRIDNLVNNLTNYVSLIEYNNKMASIDTDIDILKNAMTWEAMTE